MYSIGTIRRQRRRGAPVASGGTKTTVGAFTYHTFTVTSNIVFNVGGAISVMIIGGGGGGGFTNGYMSDVRITKSAVYNSNFVPPSAPLLAVQNTVLLINMTGAGIYDAAMMTTMETVGDAKLSTAVSKFGGSSMYFDGNGDYLLSPSTQFQNFAFGTGDFTIEMWAYPTSGVNNGLFQISSTAGGFVRGGLNIAVASAGWNQPGSIQVNVNSTVYVTPTGGFFPLNTWTHIALVRSSGVSKLYVNGTLTTIGTAGAITDASNYTGTYLVVGGYYSTGYGWNGYIDDLRITKGYARYTTTFTPPTTAFLIY